MYIVDHKVGIFFLFLIAADNSNALHHFTRVIGTHNRIHWSKVTSNGNKMRMCLTTGLQCHMICAHCGTNKKKRKMSTNYMSEFLNETFHFKIIDSILEI